MDCEGAEYEIIPKLKIQPKAIIVELHHNKNWTTYDTPDPIYNALIDKGYTVEKLNGRWVDQLLVATKDP